MDPVLVAKDHAKLSPSAAARWIQCPGSVSLEAIVGYKPQHKAAADEGTMQHLLLEAYFRDDADPVSFVGKKLIGVEVTADHAAMVQTAIDWLLDYRRTRACRFESEARMHVYRAFERVGPKEIFGTADITGHRGADEALVFDYKGGFHPVDVETSHQLRLYAIGLQAQNEWKFPSVRLVIFQPRAGGASEMVLSRGELRNLVPFYQGAIDKALGDGAPLNPSEDACRFCPAAGACPALQQQAIDAVKQEFKNPVLLTREEIAAILAQAPRIRAALDAVESHAVQTMQAGISIPGFKLVAGDAHRKWKDGVEDKLKALALAAGHTYGEMAPRKLLTPAQMDKLLGKDFAPKLAKFWVKPPGKPVLTTEDDRRPPLDSDFKAD